MATIKDKIGLAMLPSAQSGGASTPTTDFSGTVHSLLPIQYESPNLLINGGFDQDSDWTKGTGWSIGGGKAISDGSQSSDSSLYQANVLTQGKLYKFEFTLSNVVSGSVRLRNGIGSSETYISYKNTNGTYSAYATVVSSNATLVVDADSNFTGSIDNVSVQLVSNGDFQFERSSSATRVGSDGYVKNVEVLSDNLVQNGDFEEVGSELVTNGDFSDGENGWNTGAGNFDIVNGKAVVNHTNDSAFIVQYNVAEVGKIYKVEFTISDYVEGRIRLREPFINGELENNPRNGTFVYYGVADSTTLSIQSRFTEDANYKVDNISVKEVGENWEFGTNTTIVDDNGNLKMKFDNASLTQVYQGGIVYSGKKYRVTYNFDVISGGGGVRVEGGGFASGYLTTSGTKTFDFETTSNSSLMFRVGGTAITATIDNVSLVEVTDDTDIPRLDFSNAAQPSLLLEPQRTNLITNSEYISGNYSQNVTLTDNYGISPEGIQNSTLVEVASVYQPRIDILGSSWANSTTYNASAFVKQGTGRYVGFGVYSTEMGDEFIKWDLNSGTSTTQSSVSGGAIWSETGFENFGNGWYRISASITTEAVNNSKSGFKLLAMSSSSAGVGVVGETFEYYGLQLEQGSYATSYIPTNGSTVTRLADVCNNAGDSTIFNDEEGVLFVDMKAIADDGTKRYISISDGSNNNDVRIYLDSNGDIAALTKVSGNTQAYLKTSSYTQTNYNKIAFKYKENDFALWINGVEVDTDNLGSVNATNTLNELAFFGNLLPFYGNVRQVLYFNEALSDTELERLTSSDITQVLRNYNRRGELLGATYESTHVQTKLNELF